MDPADTGSHLAVLLAVAGLALGEDGSGEIFRDGPSFAGQFGLGPAEDGRPGGPARLGHETFGQSEVIPAFFPVSLETCHEPHEAEGDAAALETSVPLGVEEEVEGLEAAQELLGLVVPLEKAEAVACL